MAEAAELIQFLLSNPDWQSYAADRRLPPPNFFGEDILCVDAACAFPTDEPNIILEITSDPGAPIYSNKEIDSFQVTPFVLMIWKDLNKPVIDIQPAPPAPPLPSRQKKHYLDDWEKSGKIGGQCAWTNYKMVHAGCDAIPLQCRRQAVEKVGSEAFCRQHATKRKEKIQQGITEQEGYKSLINIGEVYQYDDYLVEIADMGPPGGMLSLRVVEVLDPTWGTHKVGDVFQTWPMNLVHPETGESLFGRTITHGGPYFPEAMKFKPQRGMRKKSRDRKTAYKGKIPFEIGDKVRFLDKPTIYTVIAIKKTRWKYPISVEGPRGGRYKAAPEDLTKIKTTKKKRPGRKRRR